MGLTNILGKWSLTQCYLATTKCSLKKVMRAVTCHMLKLFYI